MHSKTMEFEKAVEPLTETGEGLIDARGWRVFTVGETVTFRGQQFRVRKITKRDILLRPTKNAEHERSD